MREVIERGVYDKEAQVRMASLKDFQHLQTYLDELYVKDPESRTSLTAKAALPDSSKLIRASFVGIGYRVLLVFVFLILCFSPFLFFDLLAVFPAPITEYLEIQTVAAVIVIAVPLVLLFPFIGTILKMRRMPKVEEPATLAAPPPTKIAAQREGSA
jgi:hypothetical protein